MGLHAGMSLFPSVRTDCIPAATSHIFRCAWWNAAGSLDRSEQIHSGCGEIVWSSLYKLNLDQCWSQVFFQN